MKNFKKYVFFLIWLSLGNISTVDSAIYGGKVGKNLAQTLTTAAVDAGSAKIANKIGDEKHSGALNQITHKAAHGALAVAGAKLTHRDPVGAAIGAVASETIAEAMDKPDATPEERQKIAQKARLVGDTVAFLAGRDVASADSAGRTALDNNFLADHLVEIDGQRAIIKAVFSEEEAAPYLELLDADEKRTLEAIKDPIVNTIAVSAVGMGVPIVAKTLTVVGTAATAHYFGSIAVDSGTKGLVKEAKDHPIMTTLAVMPFIPKGLKGTQGATKTLVRTEQAVQQEFRFVQELQPAKQVETVVNAAPAAKTTKVVATETKPILGGSYAEVRKANTGGEVHHIPANSASSIPRDKGPAVWMEAEDHQQTGSWGKAGELYRQEQKALIDAGNYGGALSKDFWDSRGKFGKKYDEGFKQAIEYARTLPEFKKGGK